MDDGERIARGSSFGGVAAAYATHRPRYAEEAIRWALAPAVDPEADGAGTGGSVAGLAVLDLGAGTGILTGQLAGLGTEVTAVEPDPGMLAELRRSLPDVPALEGSAESIPLPDASVRAVLCGQSMHWFDLDRALPEIARVLAPGGVLSGLWNGDDDRVEWVAGLHAAAGGSLTATMSSVHDPVPQVQPRTDGEARWFAPRETGTFGNGQRRTIDSLLATIATHSTLLVMNPGQHEETLARLRDYLRGRPETAQGEFTMPIVTYVERATRTARG